MIFEHLDVGAVTQEITDALAAQGRPDRVVATLNAVSGPLASAIRNFISDRIDDLVRSDVFRTAWIEANRIAHEQMVAVLTGEGTGSVVVDEGTVSVDLAAMLSAVKDTLIGDGFAIASRIPDVGATFTIIDSPDLVKAQGLFHLLDVTATWLPVVGLVLLAIAVLLARDRRRTLLAAGLAVAVAMLLLGAVLNLARPIYLDAIPTESLPTDAAAAIYDTVVGFIRLALRAVLVVALTVAVVAWLAAPVGGGATARRGLARGIAALRSGRARAGLHTGAFGAALAQYRTAIRVGVVGCAALIYLLRDHPTGGYALGVVLVTVGVLVLVEILAAPLPVSADRPAAEAEAGPGRLDQPGS